MVMREIKFRAKRKLNADWVYGNLIRTGIEDFEYIETINIEKDQREKFRIVSNTIGQFTGLKDKNGVEVYEGDICKFNEDKDESCFFHGLAYINNNVVGGEWKIIRCDNHDGEDWLDSTAFWNDNYEVIGNIHEHKYLLND